MAKKKNVRIGGIGGPSIPPIVEQLWLSKKFDELHQDHLIILKKLDDLKKVIPEFISPELQQQIVKSMQIANRIDAMVPDK